MSLDALADALRWQWGSLLRAWLLELGDTRGPARAACLEQLGAAHGIALELRGAAPSFEEFAPEEAANCQTFLASHDGELETLWQLLAVGQPCLERRQFLEAAQRLNSESDAELLFRGLDLSGAGRLWKDEFLLLGCLEGQDSDAEEACREFLRWATVCWKPLQDLFQGGARVTDESFTRFLQSLHFKGDAALVLRQLSNSKADLGWDQVQLFRRRQGVALVRRFCRALRQRRSSVLRAWRLDLDTQGRCLVDKSDLQRACQVLGFKEDAGALWQALRPTSQHPLEICDLEPQEAANLYTITEALLRRCNYNLDQAWDAFSASSAPSASSASSAPGDLELLRRGLRSSHQELRREELDYAWLLTFTAAEIRTVPKALRDAQGAALGSSHGAQLVEALQAAGSLENLGFHGPLLDAARRLLRCETAALGEGKRQARGARPEWDDSKQVSSARAPVPRVKRCRDKQDHLMGGVWRDLPGSLPFNPSARYEGVPTPRTARGYAADAHAAQAVQWFGRDSRLSRRGTSSTSSVPASG